MIDMEDTGDVSDDIPGDGADSEDAVPADGASAEDESGDSTVEGEFREV